MVAARLRSVAQPPDQRFGSMGEAADARQAQEAGAALDRVDVSEQAGDQRRVGGVLLDAHELHRRSVDVFGRLGEKLGKQIVHGDSRAAGAANKSHCGVKGLRDQKPQRQRVLKNRSLQEIGG